MIGGLPLKIGLFHPTFLLVFSSSLSLIQLAVKEGEGRGTGVWLLGGGLPVVNWVQEMGRREERVRSSGCEDGR